MKTCLFSGSFDPPTNGHLDIIERLSKLFDRVCICVMKNSQKKPFLPEETRLALLKEICAHLPGVQVHLGEGFTVDMAKNLGACAIARGVRDVQDYAYEAQLAKANAYVDPDTETLLLMARPEHEGLSSTIVREIWSLGGDVSMLVPPAVLAALQNNNPNPREERA